MGRCFPEGFCQKHSVRNQFLQGDWSQRTHMINKEALVVGAILCNLSNCVHPSRAFNQNFFVIFVSLIFTSVNYFS